MNKVKEVKNVSENEPKSHALVYARHDRGHTLAPGLFRSLKRGERKKSKLDISYQIDEERTLRFIGFEPLGGDDLRVLQGLVALAGVDGDLLGESAVTKLGEELWRLLDVKHDFRNRDALTVGVKASTLLGEMGMSDGGENIKAFKASLVRMANVTIIAKNGTKEASTHLLSYTYDEADGKLWVALNPQLVGGILGKQQYSLIDMDEIRRLKSDPARLLHQRLCGWVDPGKSGKVEIDTLCGYVWPEQSDNKPSTERMRRVAVRKALVELEGLGWVVHEYAKGKWEIRRPKAQYLSLENR